MYVTGNFGRPGLLGMPSPRAALPLHLEAIQFLIGDNGTLVVPTHTWSLRDSGLPFDPKESPSEAGPFSEMVRLENESRRNFHAFASLSALGLNANTICNSRSRHAYGPDTPWDFLCNENALFVSVGDGVSETISAVHHAEFLAGVPYRYTREILHPCRSDDGTVSAEVFFLQVLYSQIDFERDGNRRFLSAYKESCRFSRSQIGRTYLESVELGRFLEIALSMLHSDIYSWLRSPPEIRPWTNWL